MLINIQSGSFLTEDNFSLPEMQDGLFAHSTDEIQRWTRESKTELVPTATNASWINPVECHTGDNILVKFCRYEEKIGALYT